MLPRFIKIMNIFPCSDQQKNTMAAWGYDAENGKK